MYAAATPTMTSGVDGRFRLEGHQEGDHDG
jgi:hypothetical protein